MSNKLEPTLISDNLIDLHGEYFVSYGPLKIFVEGGIIKKEHQVYLRDLNHQPYCEFTLSYEVGPYIDWE